MSHVSVRLENNYVLNFRQQARKAVTRTGSWPGRGWTYNRSLMGSSLNQDGSGVTETVLHLEEQR